MPQAYLIRVVGARASDLHRNRNLGEDLNREIARLGYGSTSDPDAMTTELQVTIDRRANIGAAKQLLKRVVAKHLMQEEVEIVSL